MSRSKQSVVTRDYRPEPDYCTRALALLLEKTVRKTATEHTPEPDGRDDTSIRNEKEVSDVDQRSNKPSEIVVTNSRKLRTQ